MKFAYASLVLVCLALTTFAQQEPMPENYAWHASPVSVYSIGLNASLLTHESAPAGLMTTQRQEYVIPREPGERRMKVGKILTAVGAVSVIAGIIVYRNRDPYTYQSGSYNYTYYAEDDFAGQFLVGIGCGMIIPGVMVWIHGSSQHRRYLERTTQQQGFYVPAGKLGLGYRF